MPDSTPTETKPVADTATVEDNQRPSRRRFLAGTAALAAPAVFTLPSNASAIAFGSFAQCVRGTRDAPKHFHVRDKDRWARKVVEGIHLQKKPAQASDDSVSGDDTQIAVAANYPTEPTPIVVAYGNGYYVDENNRRWTRNWNGEFVSPDGQLYVQTYTKSTRYTVAYVSDRGELLGTHPDWRTRGTAITTSCWISILPRA